MPALKGVIVGRDFTISSFIHSSPSSEGVQECPYRIIIHAQPDEPAIQQIGIELLHQLPLRTDRIEGLKQQRSQQSLRRNRRSAAVRIGLGKIAIERRQDFIHNLAYQTQRMLGPDPLLKVHIRKQLTSPNRRWRWPMVSLYMELSPRGVSAMVMVAAGSAKPTRVVGLRPKSRGS